MVKQKVAAAEDRILINSSADLWWNNMQAVIKLREKGTTKVSKLPSGVFRHMQENKFPNELSFRYSDPCGRFISGDHDKHLPASEKLSYDNYLVAVN